MTPNRHEWQDSRGLTHAPACPGFPVITRPSYTQMNKFYICCQRCGAVALLPVLDLTQTNDQEEL